MKNLLVCLSVLFLSCTQLLDFEDECRTDSECGPTLVCESNLCVVPIEPPTDCLFLFGVDETDDLYDPNVIRIGMLQPRTGGGSDVAPGVEWAVDLAARDINQTGGIGGRKLVVIGCDTGSNPTQAIERANWLIEGGRVSVIIGAALSSSTIEVFTQVAKPAGVLVISPSATSPSITDLPDDNLLWRTVPSDKIQARAISGLVTEGGFNKVALIYQDDAYGTGLASAFQMPYCANFGCGNQRFFSRRYSIDANGVASPGAIEDQMADLREFGPDVIVFIGFGPNFITLVKTLGEEPSLQTVTLIPTDGARDDNQLAVLTSESEQVLLSNLVGTAPAAPTGQLYDDFAMVFTSQYPTIDIGTYSAQAYDALYLIAHAFGGLQPGEAPTGVALASQLSRMSLGTLKISAGVNDFQTGLAHLQSSPMATFDFLGTSGPLDFDETGEANAAIEAWYFDVETKTVKSYGEVQTPDLVYLEGKVEKLLSR